MECVEVPRLRLDWFNPNQKEGFGSFIGGVDNHPEGLVMGRPWEAGESMSHG